MRLIAEDTFEGVRDGVKPLFEVDVVDCDGVRRDLVVGLV